jgi:hypothetical protein
MYILNGADKHLIFVTISVYILVNSIENIFYYSIGRHSNEDTIKLEIPVKKDLIKIVFVTIIFAILQGYLTFLFN